MNLCFLERIVALKGTVEGRPTKQVLELADKEGVSLARLFEFHAGHDVGLAVNLNLQAFFEIACFVSHGWSRSGLVE